MKTIQSFALHLLPSPLSPSRPGNGGGGGGDDDSDDGDPESDRRKKQLEGTHLSSVCMCTHLCVCSLLVLHRLVCLVIVKASRISSPISAHLCVLLARLLLNLRLLAFKLIESI